MRYVYQVDDTRFSLQGLLHYHITDKNKPWSKLFSVMEDLKLQYADTLEDYTISETTLEQVFLYFARSANAESRRPKSRRNSAVSIV